MLQWKFCQVVTAVIFLAPATLAKETPAQVIVWQSSGTPVVRFTFGKFKEISSLGNQHNYIIDTTAENVWGKKIPDAAFSLYLFDKNKARIGEGWITLSNIGAGESVKFQTTVAASGTPVSLEIVARSLPRELQPASPPKTISITVNSVPQGATLKVDGTEVGTTPKLVHMGIGKHILEFSKEGFNTGRFPLEIGPDDVSGGSVSYELGESAHDTVELRDGSVVNGDLQSVSATEVVMRIGGSMQHLNRNQVKRILLVEREMPSQ
ncbi:MAG TPA: PEGA domain-containing protein [Terriglobales bacterium]|nr:PEGA domain-containing protein [Terriglobales bacterium]